MSIQIIINGSTDLTISRPSLTSQQMTRSGRLVSNTVNFSRPWRFTFTFNPGRRYSLAREFVESIDYMDRRYTEDIDIGATNVNLGYITGYQGDHLNLAQQCTLTSVNDYTNSITINVPTGSIDGGYLFKAGDFIQPGRADGYPYVYTVVSNVPMPSTSTSLTIMIHRNFLPHNYPATSTFLGKTLSIGTDVRFRVQLVSKPDTGLGSDQLFKTESAYVLQEVIV